MRVGDPVDAKELRELARRLPLGAPLQHGERELELMNFPDPTPGEGEVVIEMKASGMCGSDLHQYRRAKSGGLTRLTAF